MAIDIAKFKTGTEKSPRPFGSVSVERPKILSALKTDSALTAKEVLEATKIEKTVPKIKQTLYAMTQDGLIDKRFVGDEQYYILTADGAKKRDEYASKK